MHKMMMSVAKDIAPVASALVDMLEHVPLMVLSQKNPTGTQAKTLTKNVAIAHMPVATSTP